MPILILNCAFEPVIPERNRVVSPQHKMILDADQNGGIPAPAKGLIGVPDIRGEKQVSYLHVILERHSIVFSEGLPTESFSSGEPALNMVKPSLLLSLTAVLRTVLAGHESQTRWCVSVT